MASCATCKFAEKAGIRIVLPKGDKKHRRVFDCPVAGIKGAPGPPLHCCDYIGRHNDEAPAYGYREFKAAVEKERS